MRLLRYARNDWISDFSRNHQLWGESIGQNILKEKGTDYGKENVATSELRQVKESHQGRLNNLFIY